MDVSIPSFMEAVVLNEANGLPKVDQIPVPQPGPGQILVRMAASPVNPSDLGFLGGSYGFRKLFPVVPGFEGSGTVVAAGPGLFPRLLVGKRVAGSAPHGGAWAEYFVTQAMGCIPLVKSISDEQGSMLIVNPLTAMAFFNIAKQGRHAAVVSNAAASALGRMILRLGQLYRIPVIHIVRRSEQVELLRSLGGEYILNSSDPDFQVQLRKLTHPLNATLILDPVGGNQTQNLLDAAPHGSTVVIYGSLSGNKVDPSALSKNTGAHITGFFLPDWLAKYRLRALVNIFRVQRLGPQVFHTTIQERFPLSQVQQAIEVYQTTPTDGKVLLVPNPTSASKKPVS